jgi:mannose-6-phosphate isomerase-like protein (cupin superfamily)
MQTIHITPRGQGRHFLVGTDVITIKASGPETSDTMLIMDITVPPGGGPRTVHRHQYSEVFTLLEGEFQVSTVDSNNALRTIRLEVGDTLSIPSMVWHNFKNAGSAPARLTVVHSSSIMEGFVLELGVPITDPQNPPRPDGPPSSEQMQNMMRVIQKYMEVMPLEAVSR